MDKTLANKNIALLSALALFIATIYIISQKILPSIPLSEISLILGPRTLSLIIIAFLVSYKISIDLEDAQHLNFICAAILGFSIFAGSIGALGYLAYYNLVAVLPLSLAIALFGVYIFYQLSKINFLRSLMMGLMLLFTIAFMTAAFMTHHVHGPVVDSFMLWALADNSRISWAQLLVSLSMIAPLWILSRNFAQKGDLEQSQTLDVFILGIAFALIGPVFVLVLLAAQLKRFMGEHASDLNCALILSAYLLFLDNALRPAQAYDPFFGMNVIIFSSPFIFLLGIKTIEENDGALLKTKYLLERIVPFGIAAIVAAFVYILFFVTEGILG